MFRGIMDEIMDNINLNFKFENGIQETEMTANILQEMGIPYLLTCLLRSPYAGQEAAIRNGHRTMNWFQIGKGVHQGSIFSP